MTSCKDHPQNLAAKNVILKNFKILRNDPETKQIFPLPSLISFKRDKNIGNFLVKSTFKSDNQPGTFKCKHTRCTSPLRRAFPLPTIGEDTVSGSINASSSSSLPKTILCRNFFCDAYPLFPLSSSKSP